MRRGTAYVVDGIIARSKKDAEKLIKDENTNVLLINEITKKIIQVYKVEFKTIYINSLFIKQIIFKPCLEKIEEKQLFLDWD